MVPLSLRVVRALIAALEWVLRLLVLERDLPEIGGLRLDEPYGRHAKNRADIVVPPPARDAASAPAPILIYVHGGAWVTGDKSNFAWPTRSFAHAGFPTFSINYRWAPEARFRDQVEDLTQAVSWARGLAPQYGGDPDEVFLAGDSAGAHLVLWLHLALNKPALLEGLELRAPLPPSAHRGSLVFYGIYDLAGGWELGAAMRTPIRCLLGAEPADAPELTALASPVRHVATGAAPVFVCVGEKDALFRQSVAVLEELERASVPCRGLLLDRENYPDAGHSFLNFGGRKSSREAMRQALEFLEQTRRRRA